MLRMLLTLLALFVSAPATTMPACHDATSAAATHSMPTHGHHRAPDPVPPHACVGCVPLGDWLAPRVAAPLPFARPAPVARVAVLDLARAASPPHRPPRSG